MSRGPDAATLVARALVASAAAAGCEIAIAESDWTRWASATFTGARHELTLVGTPSPGFDAWIAALPEAVFALRGHLVADLRVERVSRSGDRVAATIEILTLEER